MSPAVAGGKVEMGVRFGGGGLQTCFLSLTKHSTLCEGKTSLTLRIRDLVLEGRLPQSRPTIADMTDVLITRGLMYKK